MIFSSETRAKMAKMHFADMGASKSGATATPKMLILKEAANLKFENGAPFVSFSGFSSPPVHFLGIMGTAGIFSIENIGEKNEEGRTPRLDVFETL